MIPTKFLGLTVLAMTLALGVPAFAQNAENAPPASSMEHKGFEHPEFHEEMEKLHAEHKELDAAREKLMDRCMNAPKSQAASCQQERQDLHDRSVKLHERMKALHEKMEAARKEHREHRREEWKERKQEQPSTAPAPATTP